jgi:hypothetical protein
MGREHNRAAWIDNNSHVAGKEKRTPRERRRQRRRRLRQAGKAATGALPAAAGGAGALGGTAVTAGGGIISGPLASGTAKRFLKWTHLDTAFDSTVERFDARQRKRAELAFETAMRGIGEALDGGLELRGDGFFDPDRNGQDPPSDAEEILEGVLRAACETHEQRKAERLGLLFKFFAFHQDISIPHANHLLRTARELTYQQLLLLGAFKSERELPDWTPSGMFTRREAGLVLAILDLARRGLLVREDNAVVESWAQVNPAQMRTVLDGATLVEAMDLTKAEEEDWETLVVKPLTYLGILDVDEGTTTVEAIAPPGSGHERVKMDKRAVHFDKPTVKLEDLPPED